MVGLYLNPPENAAVFSFDEKSSIQALDRTQPGLPLKKGRCGTRTHDGKRHGASWLNLVERFFSTLTHKQIRRGVFHSVKDLETCLKDYIKTYNRNPRPLVWTKSAAETLEKVERARKTLAAASA